MDLVKAFDSVPRDVLFTVLAQLGVPPYLLRVIEHMSADLSAGGLRALRRTRRGLVHGGRQAGRKLETKQAKGVVGT